MSSPATYILSVILIFLVGLFWYLRRSHSAVQKSIESILDLAAVPPLRQALPDLILEISRARRLSHTLALVVMRIEFIAEHKRQVLPNIGYLQKNSGTAGQTRQLDLQQFSDCSRGFRNLLREVDCVAFDNVRDQFVMLLPGSTHHQAVKTINRINKQLGPNIANHLTIGIAEYPRDGLFLEDLIAFATRQIDSNSRVQELEIEVRA